MSLVRSILFTVAFYLATVAIMILGLPALVSRRGVIWVAQTWGRTILKLLHLIVGLRVEFRGLEHRPAGGVLVTYGPYLRGGAHTSPGNEAFDASLRARNPLWGVRDIDQVAQAAGREGLALEEVIPMPANNFTLVWRQSHGALPDQRARSDKLA